MSYVERMFGEICTPQHRALQGQTVIHYPNRDRDNPQTVEGVLVDLSALLGSNEMTGDGAITQDEHGDRERRTGHIEVPKSVAVDENSLWHIDGELWSTQRLNEKDTAAGVLAGWRITSLQPRRTQHSIIKKSRPVREG